MRRIVLWLTVSLDGYFEGPGGDISWHQVDDELHDHMNESLAAMGGFIHGRVTWELMAAVWPTMDADPDAPRPMREFAPIWRDMPKIVYSRTLREAGWNTEIRREVDVEEIRALQAQPGGDLPLGGADLAATFFAHDLVDELRLYVVPVLLGAGRPLFPAAGELKTWRLAENRTFGNGVVLLRYERASTPGKAPGKA
jgi:dihydrofolate reductase